MCVWECAPLPSVLPCVSVLQPSFVSEVAVPGRSALDSVEVAYGRQVSQPAVTPTHVCVCVIIQLDNTTFTDHLYIYI